MTDRCKGQNLVCIHQIEGKEKSVMRTGTKKSTTLIAELM